MPNFQLVREVANIREKEEKSFLEEMAPLRSKLLSQTAQLQNLLRKVTRLQIEIKYLKKEIAKNKKIISSKKEISLKTTLELKENALNIPSQFRSFFSEGSEIEVLNQELELVEDLLTEVSKIINLDE